jgi:hypothetical protein
VTRFSPTDACCRPAAPLGYEPGLTGRKDVAVFDPANETWSFAAPMAHGRWYPTLISLADGRVLATTGLDDHGGDGSKREMEIYSPRRRPTGP